MKVLSRVVGDKARPKDLALLAVTVAGYGIAMALAAGLAVISSREDAASGSSETGESAS